MSTPSITIRALYGANLNRVLTLRDALGPIDLTGWSPQINISREPGSTLQHQINSTNGLSVPTPTNGQIVLSVLVSGATLPLDVGRYHCVLQLVAGLDNVWHLFSARFEVAYP